MIDGLWAQSFSICRLQIKHSFYGVLVVAALYDHGFLCSWSERLKLSENTSSIQMLTPSIQIYFPLLHMRTRNNILSTGMKEKGPFCFHLIQVVSPVMYHSQQPCFAVMYTLEDEVLCGHPQLAPTYLGCGQSPYIVSAPFPWSLPNLNRFSPG